IDFDPMEFGLPPNILEVTDVHQLLSLIVAKDVLKDGGYANATGQELQDTGVIMGVGGGQKLMSPLVSRLQYPVWERVLKSSGMSDEDTGKIVAKIKKAYVGWEENSFPGALGNIVAGRIANRLNLGGTNCVVDAACASSLSGIRMAISELLEGRAKMMISGGIDTDCSPYMYLAFSKTQAFTQKERSIPFDASSDGMIMGEGVGMVLLKRIEDAERDKDRIYAVIKGIGSSSDGKFKSIYAPRSEGQILALDRAYKDAGFSPATLGMIEAHGTGTTAGDQAEAIALKDFLAGHDSEKQHIALGSVKSQIGHLKNAAGAAGLIKTALALHHKILPATININEPNAELQLDDSPFYLNTQVRPWIRAESAPPRRSAISAFGFGGTNFHFVLEEYTGLPSGDYRLHTVPQSFLLSASTPEELSKQCGETIENLQTADGEKYFRELADNDKKSTISLESARLGFVAVSCAEAVEKLEAAIKALEEKAGEEFWSLSQGLYYRKSGIDPKGKIVAVFAGQGSAYLDMGKELVCNFPPILKNQCDMDELFVQDELSPLSRIVYPPPVFDKKLKKTRTARLQLTEHQQPAVGVFSAGQFQVLENAGFKPDFVAGHSFGELTALWAAGVFGDEDYFKLAKARGKAMAAPDDPDFDAGSMLAVMGELQNLDQEIKDFPEVIIANLNSGNQNILAGPKKDVLEVQKFLKKKKYRTVLLGVSAAFHTKLMGHAQKPFAQAIDSVTFRKPKCQVYANATGKPYSTAPKSIQKTLREHILNSVLFKQEIENIYKDGGYFFVEFGPQSILTKLIDSILQDKPHISVALNASAKKNSDRQFREAVVQLKVAGLAIGNIDPYQFESEQPVKEKTALTLKLNGTNYVSNKTQRAFEEALADGHRIQSVAPMSTASKISPLKKEKMNKPEPKTEKLQAARQETVISQYTMESLERGMMNFHNHQNETLRIHEQFLANQSEYSRSFFQIMQQQAQAGPSLMSKEVAQSITQFHSHQGETLRVHEQYLQQQTEYSRNSFELVRQQQATLTGGIIPQRLPTSTAALQPARLAPTATSNMMSPSRPAADFPTSAFAASVPAAPLPTPAAPPAPVAPAPPAASTTAFNGERFKKAMLEVVSEKTGYQSEMLELDMDMEADLGIDSIKRVEILNGIQEKLPDLPPLNPEELAELRTLAQIVDYMSPKVGETLVAHPSSEPSGLTNEVFITTLLEVVGEKTGYQTEMLELEMDMEADLGIDSIKRVEILNGIQEKLPDLPPLNPEELAELRTLKQIVDNMASQATAAGPAAGSGNSTAATAAPIQGTAMDKELYTRTLLEVVSEKTGYQSEMLELNMDMEADLGIDSIKRVEILNGIQEKLPDLPELNPEALAELRTLQQIVDYVSVQVSKDTNVSEVSSEISSPEAAPVQGTTIDREVFTRILLEVVSEKTGYQSEMLELNMDMEADLGIDSIKRVEILNGIQEKMPELDEVNPEELAELRTLEQIVEKMLQPNASVVSSQEDDAVKKKPMN
ncbi:MAG: acyltransferase domain-containing protein, partial [Proteobacteria bacterium]|nr:acyltransferase domain-containing protein [Pseudomonadota bacterium]